MLNGGYGLIPNIVMYDPNLSSSAKLMFCAISSHCAERGYCWANNEYLGGLFGVTASQASRLIKSLDKYLEITNGTNEHRRICLRNNAQVPTQKAHSGLRKNRKHNSTKNITKENASSMMSVEKYLATHYSPKKTELPAWVVDSRGGKRDNDTQ